jgi:hypothetical protein
VQLLNGDQFGPDTKRFSPKSPMEAWIFQMLLRPSFSNLLTQDIFGLIIQIRGRAGGCAWVIFYAQCLPGSLGRQPCLAALPGSLAWQPCLAALPGSLAWQPCLAALSGSLARQPCRNITSLITGRSPAELQAFLLHTFTGRRPKV